MPIPQSQTNQEPLPPPDQLFRLLADKKDRFAKLPERSQQRFLHTAFRFYIQPKLSKMGIQGKDLEEARVKFTNRMMGGKKEALSTDFGKPPTQEPSAYQRSLDYFKAEMEGAGAKFLGMTKNAARFDKEMQSRDPRGRDRLGTMFDRLGAWAGDKEAWLYDKAKEKSTSGAKLGAAGADVVASAGAWELGAGGAGGMAEALGAKPLITSALKGAAGGAALTPLYGGGLGDLGRNTALGAAGGPLIDKIASLFGRGAGALSKRVGKSVEAGASPVVKEAEVKGAASAPTKFKSWMEQSPEEQNAIRERAKQGVKKSATATSAPQASTATPVAPKDSATKSSWRQQQYVKLKRAGVDPQTVRDQVHAGRTAEEILSARSGQQAQDLGTRTASTGIALQETPEVEKAVKGVHAASQVGGADVKLEVKEGKLVGVPVKVPEGQHGSGKLGQNAKKAEREAAARASAAAAQPTPEVGFEGSGKEGKGTPVPIAQTQVPLVEAMSSLKTFKTGGISGDKLVKLIEASPKFKTMPDEEKRAAIEKMYQAIGEKLGIENADSMSLDELYVRLTSGR